MLSTGRWATPPDSAMTAIRNVAMKTCSLGRDQKELGYGISMERTIKCCCGIVVEHEEGKYRMLDNVNGLTPPRVFWAPVKAVCKMRWLTEHDQKNAIFVTQIVCILLLWFRQK